MYISFGENVHDTVPKGADLTWDQFVALVQRVRHYGSLPLAEYETASRADRARDKDGRWFIAGRFDPAQRNTECLQELSGFVCDFDSGVIKRESIQTTFNAGLLAGVRYLAWTSFSHGAGGVDRWRVFIPYATPVGKDQHQALYEYFNEAFGHQLDASCAKPAQLWYLPGSPPDRASAIEIFAGGSRFFDPASITPVVHVPASNSVAIVGPTRSGTQRDVNADLIMTAPLPPVSEGEIVAMLKILPKSDYGDGCHDAWVRIGMAIYRGTEGSEHGWKIFDRWSRGLSGYDETVAETKWCSFARSPAGRKVDIGTLIHAARAAGYCSVGSVAHVSNAAVPAMVQNGISLQSMAPQLIAAPLPSPVTLPHGWKNSANVCAVMHLEPDDTGTNEAWKQVIQGMRVHRMEFMESEESAESGLVEADFEDKGGKVRTIRFSSGLPHKRVEFATHLGSNGVIVKGRETERIGDLTMDWIREIQKGRGERRIHTEMGWIMPKGITDGFAAGTTAYYSDGRVVRDVVINEQFKTYLPHYQPTGDYQLWKYVADFLVAQNRSQLVAILATAFGAPLVRFTGLSGAVLSVVSQVSGVGKSTAMQTAQAVWGNPATTIHAANDTPLSLAGKMGLLKHLPAFWDDIKSEETFRSFVPLLYQITQGKEKTRLDSSAAMREVRTWQTMAALTSNDSVVEMTKHYGTSDGRDATIARILEIRIEDPPAEDLRPAMFFAPVMSNYGHAGAIYAQWLAVNSAKAQAAVEKKIHALEKQLGVSADERFWVMIVACLTVGAALAKALKILDFDVKGLEQFLLGQVGGMRERRQENTEDSGPKELIADMLADMSTELLIVDHLPVNGVRNQLQVVRSPTAGRALKVVAGRDDGKMRVRKATLNDWCRAKNMSPDSLIRRLEKAHALLKDRNVDLGMGTQYATGARNYCYEIDLRLIGASA